MIDAQNAVYDLSQVIPHISQDALFWEGETKDGLTVQLMKHRLNAGTIDQNHIDEIRLEYPRAIASLASTKEVIRVVWILLQDSLPERNDEDDILSLPDFVTLGRAADNQFSTDLPPPCIERFENVAFAFTDLGHNRILSISIA